MFFGLNMVVIIKFNLFILKIMYFRLVVICFIFFIFDFFFGKKFVYVFMFFGYLELIEIVVFFYL